MKRGRRPGRSARALDALPERARVVDDVWTRDKGRCRAEFVGDVRCSRQLDPHEIIPRSAWATGYLVRGNVIIVCRNHHDWIGDNPQAAHELGLHGFSWERPKMDDCEHLSASGVDQVPVGPEKVWRCDACGFLYRSVQLTDDGIMVMEPVKRG